MIKRVISVLRSTEVNIKDSRLGEGLHGGQSVIVW